MTKCSLMIKFFRAILLTQIISYGIIAPKYNKIIQKINIEYEMTLKRLNNLSSLKLSAIDNEIKYDILKTKREKRVTQLSLLN